MGDAQQSSRDTRDCAFVLGCAIDRLDMDQTLERCVEIIDRDLFAQQVSINAAKLVAIQHDPTLREIVRRCSLVSADGQSVVWASRLLGDPLPERVAGIDLMHGLLALAERLGYGVYVLGARPDVLDMAVGRLRSQFPRLRVAGYRDGYFAEDESQEVAADIRASEAQILFVAISSPRKEHWLGQYGASLNVPLVMGVGGSIDIVAGITRRAPQTWQRLGHEWLYRLLQEPRRMLRRYLVSNVRFSALVARAFVRRSLLRNRSINRPGNVR